MISHPLIIGAALLLFAPAVMAQPKALFTVRTVGELTNLPPRAITASGEATVELLGYYEAYDGGGSQIRYMTSGVPDLGICFPAPGGGVWERVLKDGVATPQMAGARPGTNDASSGIQAIFNAAKNAGIRRVALSAGTWTTLKPLTNWGDLSIEGAGPDMTTLDFRGATGIGANVIEASGSVTLLSTLSGAHIAGQTNIALSDSVSLSAGAWIAITDTNEFSWSSERSYYRKGEFAQVRSDADGTDIKLTKPLFDDYDASVHVYLLTPVRGAIRNLNVKVDPNLAAYSISITGAEGYTIENVLESGSAHGAVQLANCIGCTVRQVRKSDRTTSVAINYGVEVGNCQDIEIAGCTLTTTRHGISVGGGGNLLDIVNRNIRIVQNTVGTFGTSWAIDFHGNVEHSEITGNTAYGGILANGDFITIDGNLVINAPSAVPYMLAYGSEVGYSVTIRNNRLISYTDDLLRGMQVNFDSATATDRMRGGMAEISGNEIKARPGAAVGQAIRVLLSTDSTNHASTSLRITGNRIDWPFTGGTNIVERSGISVEGGGATGLTNQPLASLTVDDNKVTGGRIYLPQNARSITVRKNKIFESSDFGFEFPALSALPYATASTDDRLILTVEDNEIHGANGGAFVIDAFGEQDVHIRRNVAVNYNAGGYGNRLGAGISMLGGRAIFLDRNRFIDTRPTPMNAYGWVISASTNYTLAEFEESMNSVDAWTIASESLSAQASAIRWQPMRRGGFDFDRTNATAGILTTASTTPTTAAIVRKDTNAAIRLELSNQGSGTSTRAGILLRTPTALSNIDQASTNDAIAALQGMLILAPASNAKGVTAYLPTAGQTFFVQSGGSGTGSRAFGVWNGKAAAGQSVSEPDTEILFAVQGNGFFKLPNITTAQRDGHSGPDPGSLLFNSSLNEFQGYNGSGFITLGGAAAGVDSFNGRSGAVSGEFGDYDGTLISISGTPTNYVPASGLLASHLLAIDYALGLGGGGGLTASSLTNNAWAINGPWSFLSQVDFGGPLTLGDILVSDTNLVAAGLIITSPWGVETPAISLVGSQPVTNFAAAGSGLTNDQGTLKIAVGAGTVSSVFGRTSDVTAQPFDYEDTEILVTFNPTNSAPTITNLQSHLMAIDATLGALSGSSGDVVGPATATDDAIVVFDLTSGKLIKNSGVTLPDGTNAIVPGNLTVGGTLSADVFETDEIHTDIVTTTNLVIASASPNTLAMLDSDTNVVSAPSQISGNTNLLWQGRLQATLMAPVQVTVAPNTAGSNYILDLSAWTAGFISLTNDVNITGLTNSFSGAGFTLRMLNRSGSHFNVSVPAYWFNGGAFQDSVTTVVSNQTAMVLSGVAVDATSTNVLSSAARAL